MVKNTMSLNEYDWLIIGAGLYGVAFARQMTNKGYKCLVIDKNNFIGGNCATKNVNGIEVHKFGAHIFHTNDTEVWNWINQYANFNNFVNSPIAEYKGSIFNLPFNMNTFAQMFGVSTPNDAKERIERERKTYGVKNPKNLEEQAISMVGKTIYETLIKGYTEKQWGKKCAELPSEIIKRLPVRYTYDNNFFNAKYQGIPLHGYSEMILKILQGVREDPVPCKLSYDFLGIHREYLENLADRILYTGPIDAFFGYKYGALEYRSLKFVMEEYGCENYQGVAVKNFTDVDIPYTRVIEHKHFVFDDTSKNTIVTYEYPEKWEKGKPEYYPVRDKKNLKLFNKYLTECPKNVRFGGRLGMYEYNDMDVTIRKAMDLAKEY